MSLRDILSPHFHESSKDQSSYIKCLTAGKNKYSFFTCRSDVILQTIFFTHARKTFVLLNETFQDQSKVYLFSNIYFKDAGHCDVSLQTFGLRCKCTQGRRSVFLSGGGGGLKTSAEGVSL